MNSHHPLKRILKQLESENRLNEDAVIKLLEDPSRFKQIVDQSINEDLELKQSIIEALNSITVPDGLKESIIEKIRTLKEHTKE